MKKILNTIWVMGLLTLAVFCLSACDRDLDVQQSYPFTVETMPVQKDIIRGQTAEIRCTLKRGGEFADTRYTIRYFQSDGKGLLKNDNGTVFKQNDRYPLTKDNLRTFSDTVVIQGFLSTLLMCLLRTSLMERISK